MSIESVLILITVIIAGVMAFNATKMCREDASEEYIDKAAENMSWLFGLLIIFVIIISSY